METDFNTEFAEAGDTEVAEKEGNDSDWEWRIGIGELGAEPFDRPSVDILRRISSEFKLARAGGRAGSFGCHDRSILIEYIEV